MPCSIVPVLGIVIGNSTAACVHIVLIEYRYIREKVIAYLGGTHHVYDILVRVSEFVRAHPYIVRALHGIAPEHTLAMHKLYAVRHLRVGTNGLQRVHELTVVERAREIGCISVQPQRVTCHFGSRRETHYHVLCLSNHIPHCQCTVNR